MTEKVEAWFDGWVESLIERYPGMTPDDAFDVVYQYLGNSDGGVFQLAEELGYTPKT
jgi:hypothetical protein